MQVQMRCGDARYAIPYMPLHVLLLLDDEGLRVCCFVVRGFRGSGLNGPLCPLFLVPRCRRSQCGVDWIVDTALWIRVSQPSLRFSETSHHCLGASHVRAVAGPWV